ncbi:MAG TPA: tetrahydromethanopterin S-methyltransferase subunit C [Methanosphaera sp.]|nr:tetrahydromethanopterin S-methyltransferase subunit C [Methanosphaera sp.]HII08953.1 tetrahydromethanopterin S-methyltransferase subunit C [Methanosphaera sp.]
MADDLIPNQILMLIGVIAGTLCIYASSLDVIGGVLAIIAAVVSTVYGTNTLRKIGKYSLGTGVPSIVYMLTAVGLVSYVSAMLISSYINMAMAFPLLAIILAVIISTIISLICKHIFKIQVEILSKSFISISVASLLLMLSMSCLLAKTYSPDMIYELVIQNGLIILIMILSVMAIQNPYNACMGPNEDQYRTLSLAVSNTFMMLILISIISMLNTQYWILYLVISLVGWFILFSKYVRYSKQQAASIRRFGLWPDGDGDD